MKNIDTGKKQLSPLQKAAFALKEMRFKLDALEQEKTEPIAIVGMSGRFPGASNCDEFWQLLQNGVDAITEIPESRWPAAKFYDPNPNAAGKMNVRCGGFLAEVDQFDPRFFGISGLEAVKMDPQHRLLLEVTWEALEHAGQAPKSLVGSNTGVYVGINQIDYGFKQGLEGPENLDIYTTTGNGFCFASGRISYTLGLQGPNMAIDTACSSSLVAVHHACQDLRSKECDMAIAGGVQLNLHPAFHIMLAKTQSLSPTGRCRTFDADADGLVLGEGCGVIVLKRLSDAIANKDNILALVRSSGLKHDGPSSGITVPNELSQEKLIRKVLAKANIAPLDVSYIETHGTATALGDPIEVGALSSVFKGRAEENPLIIGAVKTNIGHLDAAAGIAGLIKTVLSMQHDAIPPNVHFKAPSPHIDWNVCPFKVATSLLAWPRTDKPRIAGVSSFGISGTNAHVVLAEAPNQKLPQDQNEAAKNRIERSQHILTLSAKSEAALVELAEAYAKYLGSETVAPLADICFTANSGRSHFNCRLAVVSDTTEKLQKMLLAFWQTKECAYYGSLPERGKVQLKIAFLFNGEATSLIGLGRQLYASNISFCKIIDGFNGAFSKVFGQPLTDAFATPNWSQENAATAYLHGVVFVLEYALAQLWQTFGIKPGAVMGYGVGEFVAACVAELFSVEDGLQLVLQRCELIAKNPPGAAAIGIDLSHSVSQINQHTPSLPIISRLTGNNLTVAEMSAANYWQPQVDPETPVSLGVKALVEKGFTTFVAIGATSSADEQLVAKNSELTYFSSVVDGHDEWSTLLHCLASLYVKGADVNWHAFDRGYVRQRQPLPTYPFQRKRFWLKTEVTTVTKPLGSVIESGVGTVAVEAQSSSLSSPIDAVRDNVVGAQVMTDAPRTMAPGLSRIMAQQLQTASDTVSGIVAQQLKFLRNSQSSGSVHQSQSQPSVAVMPDITKTHVDKPVGAVPPNVTTAVVPKAKEPASVVLTNEVIAQQEDVASASKIATATQKLKQVESLVGTDNVTRDDWQLLLISAETESALDTRTQELVAELKQSPVQFADIARRLRNQASLVWRRSVVCRNADDAVTTLAALAPERVATVMRATVARPVAFMFPGVGDHYIDMAKELYSTEASFRVEIDRCCELMLVHLGEDLRDIIYPKTANTAAKTGNAGGFDFRKMLGREPVDENTQKLTKTVFNQPAVFTIEYALARLWMSWGVMPQAIIGYSVGEYVAACIAGVMSLEDALLLLTKRSKMIQDLPGGSMLAVPLNAVAIRPFLTAALSIAIISTPSQCVIAGPTEAILQLQERLTEKDVLCRQLQTTHAFHSVMMEPLREPLTAVAGSIALAHPQIPFLSNVTGTWINSAEATDPHYWAQHTYQTVRFADGIGELLTTPNRVLLEIGPGQNLGSFVFQHPAYKQAQDCVVASSLRNRYDSSSDRVFMLNTLGKLWLSGMHLDWPLIFEKSTKKLDNGA